MSFPKNLAALFRDTTVMAVSVMMRPVRRIGAIAVVVTTLMFAAGPSVASSSVMTKGTRTTAWLVLGIQEPGEHNLMWRTSSAGLSWQTVDAPRVPAMSSTVKPTGVVTGIVQACEGALVKSGTIPHVRVSLYSGSKRIATEMVRSGAKYRFSVSPGAYRLTGWWGSKAVTVRAGCIVTDNFLSPCV